MLMASAGAATSSALVSPGLFLATIFSSDF